MGTSLVPGKPETDIFEDQVFAIFGAIRDAGFLGQIGGPEWTLLDDREAALVIIDHVNTTTNKPWNVAFSLIRELDDTITLYLRPYVGEWRLIGKNMSLFELFNAVERETKRALITHSPPLRLYYDILAGTEVVDQDKIIVFPLEKSFLYVGE